MTDYEGVAMLTRNIADDVLQRVAVLAAMYYPEMPIDDPDFDIRRDVEWCLEDVSNEDKVVMRPVTGRMIVDPTEHREEFLETLFSLAPGTESE